jgi:hypothetical protein
MMNDDSMNTYRRASSVRLRPAEWHRLTRRHLAWLGALVLYLTAFAGGWTRAQYLPGPTQGASLRNAAAATDTQAKVVIRAAEDWGRRAGSAGYRAEHFQQDFTNGQLQFGVLRQQFNALGGLALQLGRPQADNAVAELDAGLTTIAELFTFLQNEYAAGTLDPKTIVRTCRAYSDAMKLWQRELKKSGSRLGFIW